MAPDDIDKPDIDKPDSNKPDAAPAILTEVELALILAKTIDSVNRDPEQLRHIVYDLARYKLQEQLSPSAGADQIAKSTGALETAIQGVEAFARKNDQLEAPAPRRQIAASYGADSRAANAYDAADDLRSADAKGRVTEPPVRRFASRGPVIAPETREPRLRGWIFGAVGVLLAVAVIAMVLRQTGIQFLAPAKPVIEQTVMPAAPAAPEKAATANAVPAKPAPLLPTNFGVYGLSADKLYELSVLPSRAQDVRVALSPTVAPLNAMTIPDGHLSFIVYRREAQASIPERAEVRMIARVRRGISYDAAGKPVEAADDGWYVRNISLPYRVSPIAENSEMFRIQPEKDDAPLSPGRYGLVIKGQVYDFTVEGNVVDPRQCLERLTAANGVFVSQCAKP